MFIPDNEKVRRVETVGSISEEDLKIALQMEKDGTPVPDSLREALADYKKEKGITDPAGDDPNPDDEEKDEEDTGEDGKDKPPAKDKPDSEGEDEDEEDDEDGSAEDPDKSKSKSKDKPDDEDDDDEDPGRVGPKDQTRPVRFIPIGKFNKKKEGWEKRESELLQQLADKDIELKKFSGVAREEDQKKRDEKLQAIAEKTGIELEDLKAILGAFTEFVREDVAVPQEVLEKLKSVGKPSPEDEQRQFWTDQTKKFDEEFKQTVSDKDLSDEDKAGIKANKTKLQKLAFTEGYNTKSIWEIWTRFLKPKLARQKNSPDGPGGFGGGDKDDLNWEEIAKDPAKIRALSVEQAAKMTEYMGSRKGRSIRRIKKVS